MSIFTEEAERKKSKKVPYHVQRARRFNGVAKYLGYQQGVRGGEGVPLYNLLIDIPGHPKGSTVSRRTLEQWEANGRQR